MSKWKKVGEIYDPAVTEFLECFWGKSKDWKKALKTSVEKRISRSEGSSEYKILEVTLSRPEFKSC